MKITIQPDGPRFRLFVDDGRMRSMPCGERLFREPPIPDIKFDHALLPDAERDQLEAWKQSALTVESWWKEIDEFVRKHPDAPLGRNVSDIALAWLKERDALKKSQRNLP